MKSTKRNWAVAAVVSMGVILSGMSAENKVIEEQLEPAEGWSPVGFALAPVQYLEWPGPRCDVDGLRFAIVASHNREMSGLDIAAFGCWTDGDLNGLAIAGLGTWSDGAVFGVHFASVINYAEDVLSGVQLAMVNSAYRVNGMQMGVVNCVSDGGGIQLGVWNLAESWSGFQLGLINMAMSYSGVQIGLGNIIGESPLTACVLVNAWF